MSQRPNKNLYTHNADGTITLTITRQNGQEHKILLDQIAYERIHNRIWSVAAKDYFRSSLGVGKYIALNRYIAKTPKHKYCKHINGDALDFRSSNLKNVDDYQIMSSTGVRNIYYSGAASRFIVKVAKQYLACFRTLPDAKRFLSKWKKENPTKKRKRLHVK